MKKCKVLEVGNRVIWNYEIKSNQIKKALEDKNVGVTFQNSFSPKKHMRKITRETCKLTMIKVALHYMDGDMMRLVLPVIQPGVEYAAIVSPHRKKIKKRGRIQKALTKLVPNLRDMAYEKDIKRLHLPTMEERRKRGDLTAVCRAVKQMDMINRDDLLEWDTRNTKGRRKNLRKTRFVRDIEKHSFPHRSIDTWNDLKKEIVQAKAINAFKPKLNKLSFGDGTP